MKTTLFVFCFLSLVSVALTQKDLTLNCTNITQCPSGWGFTINGTGFYQQSCNPLKCQNKTSFTIQTFDCDVDYMGYHCYSQACSYSKTYMGCSGTNPSDQNNKCQGSYTLSTCRDCPSVIAKKCSVEGSKCSLGYDGEFRCLNTNKCPFSSVQAVYEECTKSTDGYNCTNKCCTSIKINGQQQNVNVGVCNDALPIANVGTLDYINWETGISKIYLMVVTCLLAAFIQ